MVDQEKRPPLVWTEPPGGSCAPVDRETLGHRGAWRILSLLGDPSIVELRHGPLRIERPSFAAYDVGRYESEAAAMLAAELYEGAVPDATEIEERIVALGLGEIEGASWLLRRESGKAGAFLFKRQEGPGPETSAFFSGARHSLIAAPSLGTWSWSVPHETGDLPETPAIFLIEQLIVLELLGARMAKGRGREYEPFSMEDLAAWYEAREAPEPPRP